MTAGEALAAAMAPVRGPRVTSDQGLTLTESIERNPTPAEVIAALDAAGFVVVPKVGGRGEGMMRPSGYYWIRYTYGMTKPKPWEPAAWQADCWWIIGDEIERTEAELLTRYEIGGPVTPP